MLWLWPICDTILNAVLRSWYLSNWNKCVRRRAQVGLLSNRHCWRETRYLSSNWRSSYCTTSVTRRRQGPRLTWKSKSSGEPSYCTPNCHPTWFLRRFLDTLRWLSCLPIQLYNPGCGSLILFLSVISSINYGMGRQFLLSAKIYYFSQMFRVWPMGVGEYGLGKVRRGGEPVYAWPS